MDGFRTWTIAVCAAALACVLLERLFPDTGVGRQGKLLLPCVFLCVLLSPLFDGASTVKLPNLTSENQVDSRALTARMRQQTVQLMNEKLLEMVNQSLKSYGWSAKKVVANMDIAADGSISMGQILLYVDEDTALRSTAVRQVAEKRLGTEVTVVVWEDPA